MRQDRELAVAIHEAAHAVAIVQAFRTARWLPKPPPPNPIRYVEITGHGTGCCIGSNVYSPGRSPVDDDHLSLMSKQVIIEISGGIAEAFHRGGSRLQGAELWDYARQYCGVGGDLQRASAVLADLHRLIGHPFYPHEFADGAAQMLLDHWPSVSALARTLVAERRIEGSRAVEIIDRA
jgi:hypothetical protein